MNEDQVDDGANQPGTDPAELPLTPEARARPRAAGTPVEIAGMTWLLAGYVPRPDHVWDALYDHIAAGVEYDPDEVMQGSSRLLWENYTLTADEVVALTRLASLDDLADAVEAAFFGRSREHVTYSDWAAVSLWTNGVDPRAVDPRYRARVLDQLVARKLAPDPAQFVTAARTAGMRAQIRALAGRPRPTPSEAAPHPAE